MLHLPEAQSSWVGSLQVSLCFALCTISERLSDAEYDRHTLFVGSLLAVLGSFMTSLAEPVRRLRSRLDVHAFGDCPKLLLQKKEVVALGNRLRAMHESPSVLTPSHTSIFY
ncbi:conserved hypothetical protein [Verticillium alfalfae VaMs.102]|uniref:Uncharacterized protein n=1 Tax=Verticillium alfalfae (strain VaMs.102 / ATCC MYA-4576 / FGSC 10136) TaxID=526221 RepID=C9SP82_VERA1|nr:conserved hypothetical protein [Verticillium alfalfae VaMs.102]EEY20597.1 conserved hypothetical protein [Verticillium alfalfae VaMs.102]